MNQKDENHYEPTGPIYMKVEGQSVPVPEVLTEQEVVRMLRLDEEGQDSSHTLAYYRDKGLLRPTRIGKRLRYWRREILRFLERKTEMTNTQVEE
jgi:hypothetical protein